MMLIAVVMSQNKINFGLVLFFEVAITSKIPEIIPVTTTKTKIEMLIG